MGLDRFQPRASSITVHIMTDCKTVAERMNDSITIDVHTTAAAKNINLFEAFHKSVMQAIHIGNPRNPMSDGISRKSADHMTHHQKGIFRINEAITSEINGTIANQGRWIVAKRIRQSRRQWRKIAIAIKLNQKRAIYKISAY